MKNLKKLAVLAIIVTLVLSFSACEVIDLFLTSVSGNVVDIKSTDPDGVNELLQGAKITLKGQGENKNEYTGTVTSSGTWIATGVESGRYTITGSKEGWTFVPMTVDILGLSSSVSKNLLAYKINEGEEDAVLIISSWENTNYDIDSYLAISKEMYYCEEGNPLGVVGPGYDGATDQRSYKIGDTVVARLERDVQIDTTTGKVDGQPVETIKILSNPFGDTEDDSGYLRFFSHCATDTGSITGLSDNDPDTVDHASAGLTVYVMQGTEHMGTYHVAENTCERAIGILQMEVYLNDAGDTEYSIMSFGNANAYDNDSGEPTGGIYPRSFDVTPVAVDLEDIR